MPSCPPGSQSLTVTLTGPNVQTTVTPGCPPKTFQAQVLPGVPIPGPPGPVGPAGPQGPQGQPGNVGPPGTAASVSVGSTVTGAPGTPANVTDSGTPNAAVFNFTIPQGIEGPEGPPGSGIAIKGSVPTEADLPTSGNSPGDAYIVEDTGHMWVWDAATSSWLDAGNITGPPGPQGPQGPPGSNADLVAGTCIGLTTNGDQTTVNAMVPCIQSPWLQSVNAGNYNLSNLGSIGIGVSGNPSFPIFIQSAAAGPSIVVVDTNPNGSASTIYYNDGSQGLIVGVYGSANAAGPGSAVLSMQAVPNLLFMSGTTERMRLTAAGQLGIGVTAPAFTLDLSGDANVTGVYRVNGVPIGSGAVASVFGRTGVVVAQTGDYMVSQVTGAMPDPTTTTGDTIYRATTGITRLPIGAVGNVLTVSAAGLPTWVAPATGQSQSPWQQNINAASYQLQNASYIGIGVAAPTFPLQVTSAVLGPVARFYGASGQGTNIQIGNQHAGDVTTVYFENDVGNVVLSLFPSANASLFSIVNSLASANIQIKTQYGTGILISGDNPARVGINNSGPAYTLDLVGDCNITGVYRVNGTPLATGGFWVGGSGGAIYYNGGSVGIGTTAPSGQFNIVNPSTYAVAYVDGYGNGGGYLQGRAAGGTLASPTPVIAGSVLLGLNSSGWDGSVWGNAAALMMYAAETFSPTGHGNYVSIFATPIGATTGVEQMRITGAGNVGIGNIGTTPVVAAGYPWLVVGPITASTACGQITACGNTTNNGSSIGSVNFANYASTDADKRIALIQGYVDGAVDAGALGLITASGGTQVVRMWINSVGYIGVATTSPLNLFQVHGAANQNLGIRFDGSNMGIGTYVDSGATAIPMAFSASKFIFEAGYVGTNTFVGINTTTPQAELHVFGASGDPTGAYGSFIVSGGDLAHQVRIGYQSSSNYGWIQATQDGVGQTALSINVAGGFVGVGTASPQGCLDIWGPNGVGSWMYLHSNTGTVPPGASMGAVAFGWNATGGSGEGDFVNMFFGGGFAFYTKSTSTAMNPIAILNGSGVLNVMGGLQINGVPVSGGGGATTGGPVGKTFNTQYQNTTGKTLYVVVSIGAFFPSGTASAIAYIGPSSPSSATAQFVASTAASLSITVPLSFPVPIGWFYQVTTSGSLSLPNWSEFY